MANSDLAKAPETLSFIAVLTVSETFGLAFDCPGKLSWLALLDILFFFLDRSANRFLKLSIVGARLKSEKRHPRRAIIV